MRNVSQGAMGGKQTHAKAVAEGANVDEATVKNCQPGAEVKIQVGAGPRAETKAVSVHRQESQFEDLEVFLEVLQTLKETIPVYCDPEEC